MVHAYHDSAADGVALGLRCGVCSAAIEARRGTMQESRHDPFAIIAGVAAVGPVPLAVVTLTAFLKIAVILFLVRNALGTRQTPPNLVLHGVVVVLTAYVSAPLLSEI